MNFIEELYYGNINPNEKRYDKDTHYSKTMRKFCDSENELGKMLKGKPLHLVNDLINASDEIVAITLSFSGIVFLQILLKLVVEFLFSLWYNLLVGVVFFSNYIIPQKEDVGYCFRPLFLYFLGEF